MHADWQVPGCNYVKNSDGVLGMTMTTDDYALQLRLIVL